MCFSYHGEADATRQHLGAVGQSMQGAETLWKRADGQFKELMNRVDQLEAQLSRAQATFEAHMNTKMNMFVQIKDVQSEWARVDAAEQSSQKQRVKKSRECMRVSMKPEQREPVDALCQADVLTRRDGAQIRLQMQDVRRDLDETMEHLESHVHATVDRDARLNSALDKLETTTKPQRHVESRRQTGPWMKHLSHDKAAQQLMASRKTEQAQSPLIENAGPVHHIIDTPKVQHEADAADVVADEWWDAQFRRGHSLQV